MRRKKEKSFILLGGGKSTKTALEWLQQYSEYILNDSSDVEKTSVIYVATKKNQKKKEKKKTKIKKGKKKDSNQFRKKQTTKQIQLFTKHKIPGSTKHTIPRSTKHTKISG